MTAINKAGIQLLGENGEEWSKQWAKAPLDIVQQYGAMTTANIHADYIKLQGKEELYKSPCCPPHSLIISLGSSIVTLGHS